MSKSRMDQVALPPPTSRAERGTTDDSNTELKQMEQIPSPFRLAEAPCLFANMTASPRTPGQSTFIVRP
jgi:hypothetical protein